MTEEEYVKLGLYCETLMRDPYFNVIVTMFYNSSFERIASSAHADQKLREEAFSDISGVRSLLASMKHYVDEKNKIENPEPSSDDDVL